MNKLPIDTKRIDDLIHQMKKDAPNWSDQTIDFRIKKIKILRRLISKKTDEITKAISEECHRTVFESLTQEVLPTLEMSKYCESNYKKWIKTKSTRYLRPGFIRKKNYLIQEPLGLVCIITPFNFPFSLGMMTLIYVLLAGNTVILKPSEKSQKVISIIVDLLSEAGFSPEVVNVITGDGKIGNYLVEHPNIVKIFFFGSNRVGKSILEKCNHLSKKCTLELGGGTTALISNDANLQLAAAGIAWSSFYINGLSCISTEKIFIEKEAEKEFLHLLKSYAIKYQESVNLGTNQSPLTISEGNRLVTIISDAVNKYGGKVLCGGNLIEVNENSCFLENTIIRIEATSNNILNKEIFGPVVVVYPIDHLDNIKDYCDQMHSALGISIWIKNKKNAMKLIPKINSGMIWINDISFCLPSLPIHGRMNNGWGRLFSKESLHEVLELKWVSVHPNILARKRFWWYPYTSAKQNLVRFISNKVFRI